MLEGVCVERGVTGIRWEDLRDLITEVFLNGDSCVWARIFSVFLLDEVSNSRY